MKLHISVREHNVNTDSDKSNGCRFVVRCMTWVMGIINVIVMGLVTALFGPLEGWLGNGMEFLVAASSVLYLEWLLLKAAYFKRRLDFSHITQRRS